jgi:hypothetical protein
MITSDLRTSRLQTVGIFIPTSCAREDNRGHEQGTRFAALDFRRPIGGDYCGCLRGRVDSQKRADLVADFGADLGADVGGRGSTCHASSYASLSNAGALNIASPSSQCGT